MSGAALDDGQPAAPEPQLRLAVAFTGGVSLAVWMGGMAREMNLLLAASRIRRGETVADTTASGRRVRDGYAALLDVLDLDVSMDVLSGTSAGGINAVILGLANVQRFDLDGLRELWFTEGSLGGLLRNPADKQAPSLLYGDKSLLAGLREGLAKLARQEPENPAAAQDPTRVFITTTLLAGEASRFTDEYGTLVHDIDHHGLFSFTSAELTPGNVPALALAARCSASFPVAFEPGLIPVGSDGGDGHPDMAAFSNAQTTQFAADGGLLANRPLAPAVQAVFDRPADREVRRVLAFVVPLVGGPGVPQAKLTLADTPDLPHALAADATAMTSQTISADLAGIAAHNQLVRSRNDARQQLAVLGTPLDRLGAPFYPSYRARRADRLARITADEVMTRDTPGRRAADGRPAGFGADAERTKEAAATAALGTLPAELPRVGDYSAMNAAGREALDDARATVLAVLSRAYQLVPASGQRTLGRLRLSVSQAMPARPEPAPADTVNRVLGPAPPPGAQPGLAAPADQAAAAVAQARLGANMADGGSGQPWRDLAAVLLGLRTLLPDLSQVAGDEPDASVAFVTDLLRYLTGPAGGDWVDTVATRLFDLHVARYVMQPDGLVADQALELIQMSSDTRTSLDPRTLAANKLTGLQLHHFGAFCKASWRANDWMWGRLDGAGWLVHTLLDPRRLHDLASMASDPDTFRAELRAKLEQIAGCPAPAGVWTPFPAQPGRPPVPAELDFLAAADPPPPPVSLPMTAMWVASGLQRIIAGEELPHVAEQIQVDAAQGADEAGPLVPRHLPRRGRGGTRRRDGGRSLSPGARREGGRGAARLPDPGREDRRPGGQPAVHPDRDPCRGGRGQDRQPGQRHTALPPPGAHRRAHGDHTGLAGDLRRPGGALPAVRRARPDPARRAVQHQHGQCAQRGRAGRRAGRAAAGRGGRGPAHHPGAGHRDGGRRGRAGRRRVHPGAAQSPVPLAGEDRPAQHGQAPRAVGHPGAVRPAAAAVDDRRDHPAAGPARAGLPAPATAAAPAPSPVSSGQPPSAQPDPAPVAGHTAPR